jgi:hypothetical protein
LPFFGHPCRNCGVRSTARMRSAGSACDLPRSIGLASRALGRLIHHLGGGVAIAKSAAYGLSRASYALRYTTDDPRLCAGLDESQRRFRRGSRGHKPISHGSARELCGRRRYGAIDKLEHRGQRECRRNLRCMGTVGLCGAWARPVYRRLMWRPQRCTGVLRHQQGYGKQGRPNCGPQPTGKPFCNLSLVLAVATMSSLLPSQRGCGTLKKKHPELRHPLYLSAQTVPHVPGPSGHVLLQSFNQVPQNPSDPAANAGSKVRMAKSIANRIRAKRTIIMAYATASARLFLHQPTNPIRPRPVPKRGRAAGSGVVAMYMSSITMLADRFVSVQLVIPIV